VSAAKASAKSTAKTAKTAKSVTASMAAPSLAEPAIDPAQLTLLPRPAPSPEVMAAITAAAQMVWPQPAAPDAQDPVHDTWRFSGRWWTQPTPMRRARPWARR
jgi:hypothetical protein